MVADWGQLPLPWFNLSSSAPRRQTPPKQPWRPKEAAEPAQALAKIFASHEPFFSLSAFFVESEARRDNRHGMLRTVKVMRTSHPGKQVCKSKESLPCLPNPLR